MESITIAPQERKDLIRQMKREIKPSRRLRMHIVLLASEGYSAAKIARALFCSRTTLYAIVRRFIREEQEAFDDRKRRGPAPLVEGSAQKLIEKLTEEALPTERGWLRSRWSCKLLAFELFAVSLQTLHRYFLAIPQQCHDDGPVWRVFVFFDHEEVPVLCPRPSQGDALFVEPEALFPSSPVEGYFAKNSDAASRESGFTKW